MSNREIEAIKSAKRVLEVFELFASLKGPASASTIQKHFGYPQSSTSVLLKSLVSLGYLTYDPVTRLYQPTVRVNLLGAWMQNEQFEGIDVDALMLRLNQLTGDSVILGMQSNVHVQYVRILHSTSPIRLHIQTGTLRPLCRTALGKMLLTLKSDAEIGLLVRRINAESSDEDRVDLKRLLADLATYRAQGYCINAGTVIPEIGQVSMLLPISRNTPPMAIGVGGLLREVVQRWDFIIESMRHAIAEITPAAKPAPAATNEPNTKEGHQNVAGL